MGTRGCYGFYKDGVNKLTYNHFDSYPDCLGKSIVEFIKGTPIAELNKIFDSIALVNEEAKPAPEQIAADAEYLDLGVGQNTDEDWYCLLRGAQGDLSAYKKGLRHMIDSQTFMRDSLFCEWAYVINLDDNSLEIYRGFNKSPQENRYASKKSDSGYYHVRLLVDYPLDGIPESWIDTAEELAEKERN